MKSKLVFVVGAYSKKEDNGTLRDYCRVEVYAKDVDSAIAKAKKIIKKRYYEVAGVIEVIK